MTRWLMATLAYNYEKNNSNFNIFDYTNNTVLLRVNRFIFKERNSI